MEFSDINIKLGQVDGLFNAINSLELSNYDINQISQVREQFRKLSAETVTDAFSIRKSIFNDKTRLIQELNQPNLNDEDKIRIYEEISKQDKKIIEINNLIIQVATYNIKMVQDRETKFNESKVDELTDSDKQVLDSFKNAIKYWDSDIIEPCMKQNDVMNSEMESIAKIIRDYQERMMNQPQEQAPEATVEAQPQEQAPEATMEAQPQEQAPEAAVEAQPQEQAQEAAVEDQPQEQAPEAAVEAQPQEQAPEAAVEAQPQEQAPQNVETMSKSAKNAKILIGSSALVGGVIGGILYGPGGAIIGVVTSSVAAKLIANKKFKLSKEKKKGIITQIRTEKCRLIEEYNKTLEKQIEKLLSEPNSNYELSVAKLKYENQIELIKKQIQFILSLDFKYKVPIYNFERMALSSQLERATEQLKIINEKIEQRESASKLSVNLNSNITEIENNTNEIEEEKDKIVPDKSHIAKLEIKNTALNKLKKTNIRLIRSKIAFGKIIDKFAVARDIGMGLLKRDDFDFSSYESLVEEEQARTR